MSTPAVSVVICFLDAERFLPDALDSVYAQTLQDWELLLVDDGSRDDGAGLAQEAVRRRPERVRLLAHPGGENRGISASRNLGIRAARGRYLAFLDADDVWKPDKLERQLAALELRPEVAMTYGPTERWYWGTGRPSDLGVGTGLAPDTLLEPPALLLHFLESGGAYVPGICSLLVRREAALDVGAFDDAFPGTFEDQVFLARVALTYPVLVSGDVAARYRQHPDSCCAGAVRRGEYDAFLPNPARGRYLRWLEAHLDRIGHTDAAVREALRRELRPYGHPLLAWPWARGPWLARYAKRATKRVVKALLPAPVPRWLKSRARGRAYVPPPGWVGLGHLRRTQPLSREFGYDRGLPIDRHYIEGFLETHAGDVRGRTLEVGDDAYTRRFGEGRVTRSDVLHVDRAAPGVTIVADLADAPHLPSDAFDCVILTQTLQYLYDVRAAVATVHRTLSPGGVVLATVPGITQLSTDGWADRWHWSFTPVSARRLFEDAFRPGEVRVHGYGNVLAATGFLHGMAAGELRPEELGQHDPCYPLVVTVRAVKAPSAKVSESG
jgi:glycosyltransferase involved in cell wall biosynthesis